MSSKCSDWFSVLTILDHLTPSQIIFPACLLKCGNLKKTDCNCVLIINDINSDQSLCSIGFVQQFLCLNIVNINISGQICLSLQLWYMIHHVHYKYIYFKNAVFENSESRIVALWMMDDGWIDDGWGMRDGGWWMICGK